jgi:hypothetical protein
MLLLQNIMTAERFFGTYLKFLEHWLLLEWMQQEQIHQELYPSLNVWYDRFRFLK